MSYNLHGQIASTSIVPPHHGQLPYSATLGSTAGDAREQWVDFFMTRDSRDSNGNTYTYDDQYVGAFTTVQITGSSEAAVVDTETDWIMPAYFLDFESHPELYASILKAQPGDIIRLGSPNTDAYTDWMTILERFSPTTLRNSTNSDISMTTDATQTDKLIVPDATYDLTTLPVRPVCFRVNVLLNAYATPTAPTSRADPIDPRRYIDFATSNSALVDNYYYPGYMPSPWLRNNSLTAQLNSTIKEIREIRLVGYSLVSKRNAGLIHGHEMINDDYIILRFKNGNGKIMSNNEYAHGSFAVLHAGHSHDTLRGAVEYHTHDPWGIASQEFSPALTSLSQISVEVLDRLGHAAQFGRLHLWLRVRCIQG